MEPWEHLVRTVCLVRQDDLVWPVFPECLDVEEHREKQERLVTTASPAYPANSLTEHLVPTAGQEKTENLGSQAEEDSEETEALPVTPEMMATLELQEHLEMEDKTEHQAYQERWATQDFLVETDILVDQDSEEIRVAEGNQERQEHLEHLVEPEPTERQDETCRVGADRGEIVEHRELLDPQEQTVKSGEMEILDVTATPVEQVTLETEERQECQELQEPRERRERGD